MASIKKTLLGLSSPRFGEDKPTTPSYATQDASFGEEKAERGKYLQSIEKQVAAKRRTADQFGEQQRALKDLQAAAQRDLRRRSAQSLANIQARAGGGGGAILAIGNQAAAERGIAEGAQRADFGMKAAELSRQQALAGEEVAAAETEAAAERRKMLDIERGYDQKERELRAQVDKWLDERSSIWSTDDDKRAVVAKAKAELAPQLPPDQRARFLAWLDDEVLSGDYDVQGAWDI
ncbi:MAG: hypothetical protein FJ100_21360 [Deltaproteobacteria bacterium]|nr:hypothetical protein [Deltaproteobacteria bacterium]